MKTPLTPEQLEKRKRLNKKIIIYFGIPVFAFILLIMLMPTDSDSETKQNIEQIAEKEDNTTAAYIISQKFVKQRLNYPAEADFDFLPKLSEIQEENLYRVVGGVTVKNAFGVKSEIQYLCRMKYLGGNALEITSWELVDLSL